MDEMSKTLANNLTTKSLVEALAKREGVIEFIVPMEYTYSVHMTANHGSLDTYHQDSGPARILVVID